MSDSYKVGELLLISTIDERPALVWDIKANNSMYPDIIDKVAVGEFAICIDGVPDASYIKVVSPRGAQGYIHIKHVSKSK